MSSSLSAADLRAPSAHGHALAATVQIVAHSFPVPRNKTGSPLHLGVVCVQMCAKCIIRLFAATPTPAVGARPLVQQRAPFCSLEALHSAADVRLVLGSPSFPHSAASVNVSLLLEMPFGSKAEQKSQPGGREQRGRGLTWSVTCCPAAVAKQRQGSSGPGWETMCVLWDGNAHSGGRG